MRITAPPTDPPTMFSASPLEETEDGKLLGGKMVLSIKIMVLTLIVDKYEILKNISV